MGVPQGSTIGPFGWNSYSNDFSLSFTIASLLFFADDSSALVKGQTYLEVNEKTKSTNNIVVNFANENFLRLNASKSKILQMHTHQTTSLIKPQVEILNNVIDVCKESKLLGVSITDTLNWNVQCENVVSKLRKVCFLFTMLRYNVSDCVLRQVYFAYVQSHILYSLIIWGASPHIQKVCVAQKLVLRAMAGIRSHWNGEENISCRPLFAKYKILPVFSLYVLECVKFVQKYPEKFIMLKDAQGATARVTRNRAIHDCDLYVKDCTLQISAQNPIVMIARVFNHLPLALKLSVSDKNFVNYVKKMLNEQLFYDRHEYFGHNFVEL
jgi:Reverse transcriptase (RNA-dependent DNA polymerase)